MVSSLFRVVAIFLIQALLSPNAKCEILGELNLSSDKIVELSQSRAWKKILYYAPSWFRGEKSLVDDSRFFTSESGHTNPKDELLGTLRAFSQKDDSLRQDALCKYPARRFILERELGLTFEDSDTKSTSDICRRYRTFRNTVVSESVSLVFSSYFPDNPASLFGHTLLKFDRKISDNSKHSKSSALLDYGLNHSAFPTTDNPILYPLMGLSGMFPGMIDITPYYVKVQEYNNAESRDLWEYRLNLTPDEVSLILLSVFELSTHKIDYFYFDDNCSYLMLAVLDVARPSLDLTSKFNAWVIPVDTIRVIGHVPSLVTEINFRPSNIRKYAHLESQLTSNERESLRQLLGNPLKDAHAKTQNHNTFERTSRHQSAFLSPLKKLTVTEKTRVIDTALEYIDTVEKLSGAREPKTWGQERKVLLTHRSELGTKSDFDALELPSAEAPHLSYPPTRLSLGVVHEGITLKENQLSYLIGWRPALHSLQNPVSGMSPDLGIEFLNLEARYSPSRNVRIRNLRLISIESVGVSRPLMGSKSWAFEIGFQERCVNGCQQTFVRYETGWATSIFTEANRLALRGGLALLRSGTAPIFVEALVVLSTNVAFGSQTRWVSRISGSRFFGSRLSQDHLVHVSSVVALRIRNPWEIELGVEGLNRSTFTTGRVMYYF